MPSHSLQIEVVGIFIQIQKEGFYYITYDCMCKVIGNLHNKQIAWKETWNLNLELLFKINDHL